MKARALFFAAMTVAAVAMTSGFASAASGSVIATTSHVWKKVFTVPANTAATFQTSNLVPSTGDTVIHVQDGTTGTYLGGNDDSGGLASRVDLPAVSFARSVVVYVRSFSAGTKCIGTHTATFGSTVVTDNNLEFGGTIVQPGNLAAWTDVFTTRVQGGATDTVLLVLNSIPHAMLADDDSGIGYMSAVTRLPDACGASCMVVVGAYPSTTEGYTLLRYDENVHTTDVDGDGLGDAFETAIGTSITKKDTDGDGLEDAWEVIGVAGTPDQELATWGADPKKPDAFVELDWTAGNQLSASLANTFVNTYAPDIRVHLDNGLTNTDPNTWLNWGNWGGAALGTDKSMCAGFTTARRHLFHHVNITGGGGQTQSGYCSVAGTEAARHEVGHQLGLQHAGATSLPNCKPNYYSPMNYAWQNSATSFSRGTAATIADTSAMNENTGLGTTDATILGHLHAAPFLYDVNFTTGAVDWNRNGTYDGVVWAAPNLPGDATDCALGDSGSSYDIKDKNGNIVTPYWGAQQYSVLAQYFGSTHELYMFSRASSAKGSGISYRKALNPDACFTDQSRTCPNFTPGPGVAPIAIPNSAGIDEVGATGYTDSSGAAQMMIAYTGTNGSLYCRTVTAASPVTSTVRATNEYTAGGASAINFGPNKIHVYALTNGYLLKENIIDKCPPSTNTVHIPTWQDGTSIGVVATPVAVRAPRTDGDAVNSSMWGLFVADDGVGTLIFAEFDETNNVWIKHPEVWPTGNAAPQVSGRPGLAYLPLSASNPYSGRFVIAYSPRVDATTVGNLTLQMTQGNDRNTSVTVHKLVFMGPRLAGNEWNKSQPGTGVSLSFTYLLDRSLRLARTTSSGDLAYEGLADGVYQGLNWTDYDDYAQMKQNLVPSLQQ